MEQPEAPRVAFYKYLRAFYPFDSAGEVSPSTVILPLDQGDIILIHSTHTNGWADGTSLNSGNRGWLPTNYCEEYNQLPMRPLLKALTDFWDIIQRGCGSSLKDFGNQDLMRGPIAGVRFLLEKSECLTRDAPLVEKYESIRQIRKALLSNLSSLVKTAKQFYDTANGAPVENEVEMILDEMLLKAFKIITCGVCFLDVWNEEVGLPRTIEEMERAGIQFDMPPKPASATSSLADTAPIPETCTEQNESQQISHNHMDFSQMSIQTEALDQQSLPMSVSASHVSLSHQNPYSGPLLAIPTQNLALERLGASYDAFLGVLGGFIGIHNSLSSDELVTTTQQAVQSCQALLNVIDAVSKKDAQRGALLDEAREAMCERLSELDHAARDVFQPTNSPDNDLLFMPDEGKRLVDAATDCVRAAGNCLVKARLVLKQIGDIELDPVQEEATTNEDVPSVIASQASPDIPTDEEKPQELSPSLHPPSTHGLSEQIGDTELNPQSLESAISLDHSDEMDFVLTEPSLMDRNFSDTIGSVSQYSSDQMFSAGQPSILDSQTALTAPTAPTAPTASGLEVDTDDLRTIYSDTLTMDTSDKEAYINELAHELFKAVSTFRLDSASMKRVADAMPGYLKAFSSRLGCTSPSQQVQRDVTVFIHKYRHEIANAFGNSLDSPSTETESIVDDNMPLDEKFQLWLRHDADSASDDEANPSELITPLLPLIEIDEESNLDGDPVMPELQKYRECLLVSPAYDWLLGHIQSHCVLEPSNPDIMADISCAILQGLPSQLCFSRRKSVPSYKMTYTLDRGLVSFLEDQEYSEDNAEALPLVITLTGSREAAQALTCSQYLHQTWPSSAGKMLQLLQDLLRATPGEKTTGNLPDGTDLVAWFHSSEPSKNPKIVFQVKGSAYSIAEVGEQLSWLGSALRSSCKPDQVVYCQPQIDNLTAIPDEIQGGKKENTTEFSADISFAVKHVGAFSKRNGECWHDLFRSGVVVDGFPICRRPDVGPVKGLDVPLPMMARLAQANYVNTFLGSMVIKGFSSMLIPTENYGEVIVWHLVHNRNGDRISYLDSTVLPIQEISTSLLSQARHILGWSTNANNLAGTRDAAYDISGSHLPRLRPGDAGLLSQAFIYNGQIIKGGAPFLVGYKDTPPHVSRGGYLMQLRWIVRKSVVLWDEEAKRGWLLNGASTLLHLVRASILHDVEGPFSSECHFRWETFEEGKVNSITASKFAIDALLNPKNRALTIYEGEDDHVKFEDRVKHFLNILEQISDYQVRAAGPGGSGYKAIPRAHFEGWDFHDLATELDPLHPRRAIFAPKGKAWVDFTRSIHAINLLGRNFGEILAPSDISCPYWASLPRGEYYLAVGISDLKMILEYTGDPTTNPIRLSENLVWHNSDTVFEPCGCAGATVDHTDIVQVILPDTLSVKSETCLHTANLSHHGAIIFGYNRNFEWRWGDAGEPERDEVQNHERTPLSTASEIENTNTSSLSVGSDSDVLDVSSSQVHSTSTEITSDSAAVENEPVHPEPLIRSYTRWRLESLKPEDYAVGIVCALPLELFAVRSLFDQTHPDLPLSTADTNHYVLGSMGRHKVVAACLPDGEYGTNSAADVAANLRRSFPSVKFCLLVGIGGGVPSSSNDIRLGDVVVSKPSSMGPGVVQYDMGKALENGDFQQSGFLQPPPRLLMTALSSMKSDPEILEAPLQEYIQEIAAHRKEYRYPGPEHDRLFSSHYAHNPKHATCDLCNAAHVIKRPSRSDHHPKIYYGLIASGNRVMKDAKLRDMWSVARDVLCFEMEAAGIMNTLPCLVIRGICDYSDSHKNKRFQEYAAATAASYAKLLLSYVKDSGDLRWG